jgi:trehalose 6-phosphate synthase/phosphatase
LATEYLQNEKKDLIWVHDTYLLLVPFYLRTLNINANIGLSMHSPFPSSDIYKTFPFRAEVLKSMMCSDLISFHGTIFKKGGFIAVSSHGREVMLRVSHIAIEVSDIHDAMDSSEFLKCKKLLSNQIPEMRGKYIISSYDRSHPISGIR